MAVNDNVQNPNENLRNENISRERQDERRENRRERQENRDSRQNNNMAWLACVPFLAGMNRNNTLVLNQNETQTRDFSTNFIPSSIEIFDENTNSISPGNEVIFSQNNVNTGISYTYNMGNTIEIIANGVYTINFSANVSGNAENQTANFAIAVDGTLNTISQITQTVLQEQIYNVKTQLILKVVNAPVTISVLNNGNETIDVSNANLTIIKTANF